MTPQKRKALRFTVPATIAREVAFVARAEKKNSAAMAPPKPKNSGSSRTGMSNGSSTSTAPCCGSGRHPDGAPFRSAIPSGLQLLPQLPCIGLRVGDILPP
jgi:hypothetical protein